MIINNNNANKNTVLGGNNNMNNIFTAQQTIAERITEGLYDSSKAINVDLLDNIQAVNCLRLDNKQKAFATMSYSFGSLVGVTTTGGSLALTIMTNPDQFFTNGTLSLKKIRKVFKNFGRSVEWGTKYRSVFSNYTRGVVNKFGRYSNFVMVSPVQIELFLESIEKTDFHVTTKEDLVKIAKDMDVITRAMQELAIDVTKDKTKDIGYNIMSFIQVRTKTYSRRIQEAVEDNMKAIIDNKLDGKNETIAYEMGTHGVKLEEADEESKSNLAGSIVMNIAGEMMEAVNDGYKAAIESLLKIYKDSNSVMYNEYLVAYDEAKNNKKVAYFLQICRIALNSINDLFASKSTRALDSAYVKEMGRKLRAALYTEGAKIGFEPKDVVRYAISASFGYFNGRRFVKGNRPSLAALWCIFPNEFVIEYATRNSGDTIADILTVNYTTCDLCLGDEFYFEEGYCEANLDDMIYLKEDYTGKAVVTVNGLEAVVDHYAYEEVNATFLHEIYERNVSEMNAEYVVPNKISSEAPLAETMRIMEMIKVAHACAISSSIQVVDNAEVMHRDFVINKGNKISVIGKVLSISKNTGIIDDAVIGVRSGVVFYK